MGRIAKAIAGAIAAFGAAIVAAEQATDGHMTPAQWVIALGSAMVTLATVYQIPNS